MVGADNTHIHPHSFTDQTSTKLTGTPEAGETHAYYGDVFGTGGTGAPSTKRKCRLQRRRQPARHRAGGEVGVRSWNVGEREREKKK